MHSEFDFQYAIENTQVLHEPDRRIDTFGSTRFEFNLVSELMDSTQVTRVRSGRIEAEKPMIIKPEGYESWDFEGFGPEGQAFGSWLKDQLKGQSMLRYGFHFKRSDVTEEIVHDPMLVVCDRLSSEIRSTGNPMRALIQGVDDTWEISLLKFMVEMIDKSININRFDFKRRGFLG